MFEINLGFDTFTLFPSLCRMHFLSRKPTPKRHSLFLTSYFKAKILSLLTDDELSRFNNEKLWQKADEIQASLELLQNRMSCNPNNTLVCNINVNCGFGCQLHLLSICLLGAYANNRTLVLNATDFPEPKGFETYLKPLRADPCGARVLGN